MFSDEEFRLFRNMIYEESGMFLKDNKKWWLAPIVVTLLLVGALLVVTESSAVAPFIYALF